MGLTAGSSLSALTSLGEHPGIEVASAAGHTAFVLLPGAIAVVILIAVIVTAVRVLRWSRRGD